MASKVLHALGVVLLEQDHAMGDDLPLPPWSFRRSDFWPFPTNFSVAWGADPEATLRGDDRAVGAVANAIEELEGDNDLIIGNCGFFWAAWDKVAGTTQTPLILSALDLLPIALRMSTLPVGILTYSAGSLEGMLEQHDERHRLRIVGLEDLSDWSALRSRDYVSRGGWSVNGLEHQLVERTRHALEEGEFSDVGVLVLECTVLPYFRQRLRELTNLPMIDVASVATALLG